MAVLGGLQYCLSNQNPPHNSVYRDISRPNRFFTVGTLKLLERHKNPSKPLANPQLKFLSNPILFTFQYQHTYETLKVFIQKVLL